MISTLLFALATIVSTPSGIICQDDFIFQRTLNAPDTTTGVLASFRLDNSLYLATRNGFEDIRIFNEMGQQVAFTIRTITVNDTDITLVSVPLRSRSFRKTNRGEGAVIYERTDQDLVPEVLDIITSAKNFEKTVSVLGSNDLDQWVVLAENYPIFDYTRYIDIRKTRVAFNRHTCRYYKVVIDRMEDFTRSAFSHVISETRDRSVEKEYTEFIQHQEAFRLEEVTFSAKTPAIRYGRPLRERCPLQIDSTRTDSLQNASLLYLYSDREPVDALLFSIRESNFIRRVTVHGTNDTAATISWNLLSGGEISNVATGNYHKEQLTLALAGLYRYSRYRITIYNDDNTPVTVDAVTGVGPRHEILFFHADQKKLLICYGSPDAKAPSYDITTILQHAPVVSGTPWQSGEAIKTGVFPKASGPFDTRYILFGVLATMVIVLVMVLVVAMRKVDEKTQG